MMFMCLFFVLSLFRSRLQDSGDTFGQACQTAPNQSQGFSGGMYVCMLVYKYFFVLSALLPNLLLPVLFLLMD